MELNTVWQILFVLGLVGFGIWFSALTHKLNGALENIHRGGDDLDEIKEAVETVALILNKLPELMPTFHQHNNPLEPIFQAFAQKIMGEQQLNTVLTQPRTEAGQYATTQEEI